MTKRDGLTPLSTMRDYKVSNEDPDVRGWTVVSSGGERLGTVRDLMIDPARMKAEYFAVDSDDGQDILVPAGSAQLHESRREVLISGAAGWDAEWERSESTGAGFREAAPYAGDTRLTRTEEELRIGTREVEAGEVVVGKHVETERITQDVPVARERVRVERRPVSDARGAADIGPDEIRVPVIEEELVVEKRPVVKEELVISKERVTDTERVDTEVRKEQFDIAGDANLLNEDDASRRGRR